MAEIKGKSYILKRLYGRDNYYSAAYLKTNENKKVKVYFHDSETYQIACDAHITVGAVLVIEYDMILSEKPLTVVCKMAKIEKEE